MGDLVEIHDQVMGTLAAGVSVLTLIDDTEAPRGMTILSYPRRTACSIPCSLRVSFIIPIPPSPMKSSTAVTHCSAAIVFTFLRVAGKLGPTYRVVCR